MTIAIISLHCVLKENDNTGYTFKTNIKENDNKGTCHRNQFKDTMKAYFCYPHTLL